MNASEVLTRLREGNKNFVQSKLLSNEYGAERRKALVGGQDPYAIVLSCADSRVVPELIFDTGIGDLFVTRVAGNVANTSTIASIEYAVAHLNCKVLMVLGHQNCGAINAALKGGDSGKNLNHLMGHLKPVLDAAGNNDTADDIARTNAKSIANELISRSAIISNASQAGEIRVIPAYYHLDSGVVDFL